VTLLGRRELLVGAAAQIFSPSTRAQKSNTDSAAVRFPVEHGVFRPSQLVELIRLDSTLKLDIRYATTHNFTGRAVYAQARAFLQRDAALALVRAHASAKKHGFGLAIFDGYRPWRITKLFWDITPVSKRDFVAKPSQGSRHNRGCAVDLTLHDLRTGRQVMMPSDYDDFSRRAAPDYAGGTAEQRRLRNLLRQLMEQQGFTVFENEWWHFDYRDWRKYRILDVPFEAL
jgi:zinc D-Ala-D-Ala dipeptidase